MKKNTLIRIFVTLLLAIIVFYITIPPLHISSSQFWFYVLGIVFIYMGTGAIEFLSFPTKLIYFKKDKNKISLIIPMITISVFASILIINLFNTPFFRAKSYQKRIKVEENATFTNDLKEVDFNTLPLLDKNSSQKLGDRVMGQMPELVSQFRVSDLYTQINYKNDIIRVTPLEYNDWIKYLTNRKDGVKGYITVNSVTGQSKLVKLKQGMKYLPSALFNENLYRHLRFSYPTTIFGKANFEIDNEGNPYWIIPTIHYTAVGLKKEITGVVVLDPITGKSKKYKAKDVPKWIDHVYDSELIIEQLDHWGLYKKGYLNSLFGQKDVVLTTDGYNYTVMNDDVYLYTGITSISADQATIGFVMSNLRTKETKFYKVPGALETSAMASAEGQVQQMKYTSTFPLLINLKGHPTYLVSLKDHAGLVKMYGFIDVEDYQRVVVTDAQKGIEAAANAYLSSAKSNTQETDTKEKEITIAEKITVSLEGTTWYYLKDTDGKKYKVSLKVDKDRLPFIKEKDSLHISYTEEKDVTEIVNIK